MEERLQKIIARAGIASRRHAEQLILSGQVRVNGRVVTELGTKADAERDRIEAGGRVVAGAEGKIYLAMHKPPQVVSTLADPEGRKTLRHFLRGLPERVYPVGRLDYGASGLVLLTNDGDFAARMMKAAGRVEQTYWIKVKGRLENAALVEMGRAAGAKLRPVKQPGASRGHTANYWYVATLRDARRDALRRALGVAGHPVEKMKRVGIGRLELGGLAEGHYRRLEPEEVAALERELARNGNEKRFRGGAAKQTREQ